MSASNGQKSHRGSNSPPLLFKPSDFFVSSDYNEDPNLNHNQSSSFKQNTFPRKKSQINKIPSSDASESRSSVWHNESSSSNYQADSMGTATTSSGFSHAPFPRPKTAKSANMQRSASFSKASPAMNLFTATSKPLPEADNLVSSLLSPDSRVPSTPATDHGSLTLLSESAVKKSARPSIGLFWDIENCRVTALKSEMSYINLIREKFCKDYICDEFICVCAVDSLSDRACEELNNAQVTLAHVPSGAKNAADEKLRQKLRRFGEVFAHQNAAAILITGDINFISDITDLRHRCGVKVILIHNGHTNAQLKSVANETFLHEDLLSEIDDRAAREGMQYMPQELIVKNLPLNQAEVAIRNRLSKLCDNCGGRISMLNKAKGYAFLSFSSPESCERAYIRLQNKEVLGNKIQVDIALRPSSNPNVALPIPKNYSDPSFAKYNYQNMYQQPSANVYNQNQIAPNHYRNSYYSNNSYDRSSTQRQLVFVPQQPASNNRHKTDTRLQLDPQSYPTTSRVAPLRRVISDQDVIAVIVKVVPELDCSQQTEKIRSMLTKCLKSKGISYKTAFSKNSDSLSSFAICFKSDSEMVAAKNIISSVKYFKHNFVPQSVSFHDEDLEDLKINVLALLDTDEVQIHTFFLNYWQKFDKFFRPSLLNYLIDDLIEVKENEGSTMKHISLKSTDPDLEKRVLTYEYLKPMTDREPGSLDRLKLLGISDSPPKVEVGTVRNRESSAQSSPPAYVLYLNYDPHPFHRCPVSNKPSSIKKFSLKLFTEQVYQLVSDHGGFIPMAQFLNCFNYKFGPLRSESKIAFEQLLLSIDGISTFMENSKCVCFSSLDLNYKEFFSDVRAPLPVLQTKITEFTTEVLRQLQMADSKHFKVHIQEFLSNYRESKQREFNSTRYGFQDAKDLFTACRAFFTVIGTGVDQYICYSRRMNTQRFGSFLHNKLQQCESDLTVAVRKLTFDPVDYGFFSVEDMCSSEWLQLAVSTQKLRPTSFDSGPASVRDISSFSLKVFVIVASFPSHSLSYDQFLTEFQEKFNRPVNASEFGFTDLKELLLATELVWITDSPSGASKTIMFRPLVQLLHQLVMLLNKINKPVKLSDLPRLFEYKYQKKISCFKYGFQDMQKLLESVPAFISFTSGSATVAGFGDANMKKIQLNEDFKRILRRHAGSSSSTSQTNSALSSNATAPTASSRRFALDQAETDTAISLPTSFAAPRPSTPPFTPTATRKKSSQGNNSRLAQQSPLAKYKPPTNAQGVATFTNSFWGSGDDVFDERKALAGPQMPASSNYPGESMPLPPAHFFDRS